MVEQPYTVCRPVTTTRQEIGRVRLLRAAVTHGPRPGRRAQGPRPGAGMRRLRGAAARALRLPPQEEGDRHRRRPVPAADGLPAVFVSRPVVRDVTETTYVRETMTRQVPFRPAVVAEERVENVPGHHLPDVAEERVEPYEVRTCNFVARGAGRELPGPDLQLRRRGAGPALRGPTCAMVAEERVETIPVTTCSYVAEERVEPYEVRTCRWSPRSGSRTARSPPAAMSPRSGPRSSP